MRPVINEAAQLRRVLHRGGVAFHNFLPAGVGGVMPRVIGGAGI
jgi:hypothetical protein